MIKKEIKNMGEITFSSFFNPNNIKISNPNKSPIRESIKGENVGKNLIFDLIDNDYIFSLLKVRKNYQIFICNPIHLLSEYRYDVFVKYFYVKSYIENTNIDLAKKNVFRAYKSI